MDLDLKGKRVLVSGSTRGIGLAIARGFVREGARVGLCARNASGVHATIERLSAEGPDVIGEAADAADPHAIRAWVENMAARLGGIDAIVSNVSALGTSQGDDVWQTSLKVDILALVAFCEAAMPHLEDAKGSIVAINTTGSVQVYGPPTPYPVVKAAALTYMKYLSHAVAAKGVRVNAVSPGSIYFEGGLWHRRRIEEPERYERMLSLNPMGRFGTPEEVADAVLFLSSKRASFISGTNLVVDGAGSVRIQN